MLRDLPRLINEQSVINIERLAGKRDKAGEHGKREKDVMNVTMIVAQAVGRRCHQECSKTRCP